MIPTVWAPFPERVDLVLADRTVPLTRDDDGWWKADIALEPGTDYGFSLDGGPPLPDPRSPSQPDGVHGLSRVVAAARSHSEWRGIHLASAILYEMHVGTFSPAGTFTSAIDRLDDLVALGVDAVKVMPINQFSGEHGWGYDGVGLFAPHHAYGGPDGLRLFVEACHQRGLGVILDVVYNHFGPEGNYLGRFGPYFTDVYRTPWGDAVNLDGAGSDNVRAFILDNAVMWMRDYEIDGLRIDAVHAFFDRSAVDLLEELAERVIELEGEVGRPLSLIAESDLNDPRLVWSRERGGYGLDATWSDDFHHALHAALTGETDGYYADFGSLSDVATALQSVYVYDGKYSAFRGRRHGRPVGDLTGTRFLGYLQNHDQVGNRARGDRIGHLAGPERQKIGAALVLTAPFVPMIFQGEEWAASTPFPYFTDHANPELAVAVREGRRREFAAFGWSPTDIPDPQDPATFRSAKLDWDERHRSPHSEMLDWYRRLIELRRSQPDLTDGRLDRVSVTADDAAGILVMRRGRIVVAVNLGARPKAVDLPADARHLLASIPPDETGERLQLSPASVAILELEDPSD